MRKFLLLMIALLAGVSGAWADVLNLTPSDGTYVTSSGNYVNSISFSTSPAITVTASANNMDKRQTSTYLLWHSGQSGSCTYTISAGAGYIITAYSVTGEANTSAQTLTAGAVSHEFAVGVSSSFEVTGLKFSSVSFVQTGANASGLKITSISVTVEEDSESLSWIPSFGIGSMIVVTGEKTESITAATNGADNDHWYLITQVRGGESALYDNGTQLMRGTADKTAASFNGATVESNSAYLVRFISAGSEDLYHIQLGNGRYIVNLDANPNNGTAVNTTSDYWRKGTHAFYNSNGGSGSYFGWNLNSKTAKSVNNNGAGSSLSYWGEGTALGTSGNHIWYVYPVEIGAPVSMTYKVIVNGSEAASATENQPEGGTLSLPTSAQKPFCTYEFYSTSALTGDPLTTIPAEATTVYAKPIWNGPFAISTDFENANWNYLMQSHQEGTKNYVSYSAENPCPVSGTKPTEDNGLWAFIGNAYDGFKIINKAAGDGKYLEATANYPTMTTTQTAWVIANRSGFDAAYFNIHSGSTNYINLNNTDHVLKYWNDGRAANDNNSTFRVEEYSEDFTSEVATDITPYFDTHGEYFSITDEAYTANLATWTAAKSSCNKATYNSLRTIISNNIIYPDDGWYLIKNYSTEHYINTTGSTSTVTDTNNAPSSIVYLDNRGDGTYYIQSQGGYFQTPNVGSAVTRSASPVAFTPEVATAKVVDFKAGSYGLADSGGTLGGGYLRGTATDPASYWTVEDATEVTVSMNPVLSASGSFATICFPFDVTIETPGPTSGAFVYTVSIVGSRAQLNELGSQNVPAGTPVLLAAAYATTSVTATITSGLAAYDGSNDLRGTYFDKTSLEENEYILGTKDGKLGFWKLGSGRKLGANKAYLLVPGGGGVKGYAISFDELVDGINTVQGSGFKVQDSTIYNLAGQRISKLQRGVNIVNGKKVLVK